MPVNNFNRLKKATAIENGDPCIVVSLMQAKQKKTVVMFWRHLETSHPVSVAAPLCSESPRYEESAWYRQIGDFCLHKKTRKFLGVRPDSSRLSLLSCSNLKAWTQSSLACRFGWSLPRRKGSQGGNKLSSREESSKGFGQPLPNAKASRVAMRR